MYYIHTYSYVLMIEIPIYSSETLVSYFNGPETKKRAQPDADPSMTLRSQGTREGTVWVPNARRGLSAHEDMISRIDEMIS